jgi:hypothetical protein
MLNYSVAEMKGENNGPSFRAHLIIQVFPIMCRIKSLALGPIDASFRLSSLVTGVLTRYKQSQLELQ